MDARSLIIMAVIGVVAGWLASFFVGGSGMIRYLVTGVIGSFAGGFLFSLLGLKLGLGSPLIEQIIVATIGAVVVVIIARMIS